MAGERLKDEALAAEQWDLIAVRHGQSLANHLLPRAEQAGREVDGLPARDIDVPLTPRGRDQARVLGGWLATPGNLPDVVCCSPFLRARQTYQYAAERAAEAGRALPSRTLDDRLGDREQGALQLLSSATVRRRFPEEHARRLSVGALFHRPTGGEAIDDVATRVAALLAELRVGPARRTLWITHDAVILTLRMLLDGEPRAALPETPLVANASVSRWQAGGSGRPRRRAYGAPPSH